MPQLFIFPLGFLLVIGAMLSAFRTFVMPRGEQVLLTRAVFIAMRRVFNFWIARSRTFQERDRVMGYYAPASLMMLVPVWLILVWVGYTAMFLGVGVTSVEDAFKLSGSSLFTLGFIPPSDLLQHLLAFSEAAIGLALVAIFIAYLPTMYAAFQRRESLVTLLDVRAGAPPSAVEMIERFHRIHGLDQLTEMWERWEEWFAEVEESHTSLAALIYFRSPVSGRSWVTAAGAVLDGAALTASTLAIPRDARADLCLRAGYLALYAIGDLLNFNFNHHPNAGDPISIAREEFDAAYDRLAKQGIPTAIASNFWGIFKQIFSTNYPNVVTALGFANAKTT
jgi:hypothetical protein